MAEDIASTQDLRAEMADLEPMWQSFQTHRVTTWPNLFRLRSPSPTDPNLEPYADGIDIETPVLAYDRGIHMKIKRLNPTKIDAVSMTTGEDGKKAAEKQRIFYASTWNTVNAGGKIDAPWSQTTSDSGVFFARVHWQMPLEPKEDEITRRVDKMRGENEDDDEYEAQKDERSLKARSQYFEDTVDKTFWIEPIGVGELMVNSLDGDHTLAFQKSEISLVEARNIQRSDKLGGGYLTIDKAGTIGWLGERMTPQEWGGDTSTAQQTVLYIVKDYQDPETKEWRICEYVCLKGKTDQAEKVNEYANPFGCSSYLVVPSGDEVPMETDPHLRFMPTMWAEIMLAGLINYLTTQIAIIGRRETVEDIYLDISSLTTEAKQYMLEKGGAVVDGVGAGERLVFKRPEPGSGDLAMYPGKLSEFPKRVSEHLMVVLQMAKEEFATVRPNRLVVGDFVQSKEPDTATMGLNQMQAASLLWGGDLVNKDDKLIRKFCDMVRRAVLYWDKDSEGPKTHKQYPVVTTGDEPGLGWSVEPGKSVVLTAEDFKPRVSVKVMTKNETQAEKAMNDQLAEHDYDRGEDTWQNLLKRKGNDNPIQKAKELEMDRIERQRRPRADQIRQMAIETYVSAKTRLNVVMLSGGPTVPQQEGEQGQKPAAGQDVIAKPQMTPAPITGATGGNQPSMGVSM